MKVDENYNQSYGLFPYYLDLYKNTGYDDDNFKLLLRKLYNITSEAARKRLNRLKQWIEKNNIEKEESCVLDPKFRKKNKEPKSKQQIKNELGIRAEETLKVVIDQLEKEGKISVNSDDNVFFVNSVEDRRVNLESKNDPVDRLPLSILKQGKQLKDFRQALILTADWHFGSKVSRPDLLTEFIKIGVNEYGANDVLAAGDITDGYNVYKGHLSDLLEWRASRQVDMVVNTVPKFKGVNYHFIEGNHDESHWKSFGYSVCEHLDKFREDFHSYGSIKGDLIVDNLKIRLFHGKGKGTKNLSHVAQEIISRVVVNENPVTWPDIVVVGHYHHCLPIDTKNMYAVHPGAFQGENNYTKAMNLTPQFGGVVLVVEYKAGLLTFTPHCLYF